MPPLPPGLRLIVTRPAAQAGPWVAALRKVGVDAVALPLIGIEPPARLAAVHATWRALPSSDWVMFVSANAVEQFFAARPAGATWPAGLRAGAPGPGTQAALAAMGVVDIDSPGGDDAEEGRFDSEALWRCVAARDWAGRRAWVVRGEDGRDWLADTLRAAGAQVEAVAAYRRVPPRPDAAGQTLLEAAQRSPAGHVWQFTSSEAVRHLQALAPRADWQQALALTSHPRIAEAAQAAGFGRVRMLPPVSGLDEAATKMAQALAAVSA
jgi:uroporphyrinogen-III synthase